MTGEAAPATVSSGIAGDMLLAALLDLGLLRRVLDAGLAGRELDFKLVRLDTLITRYAEWDRPENSSPPRGKRAR